MPSSLRGLLFIALSVVAWAPAASAQESAPTVVAPPVAPSTPEVPEVPEVPENPYDEAAPPVVAAVPAPRPEAGAEAPSPEPEASEPMRRPPYPPDYQPPAEAEPSEPPHYQGLLLAGGPVTWRMNTDSPEAGDLLGGLRIEGGYSMVGHDLYGSLSALYMLGDLDGFAGYGAVGLGLRGFMGRLLAITASAQITYGLLHRGDELTSGVGFLVSAGAAVRYRRLQVVLEVLATGSEGCVQVGPSLMFGSLL